MKILEFDDKRGFAKLRIDNLDDLWLLTRVINKSDIIGSETTRIVKKGDSEDGQRKKMYVKLEVDKLDLQGNVLRILGKLDECSNPEVPLGSFHTISVEPSTNIELFKSIKKWELQRIKEAEESSKRPKVLLCAADYGDATVAIVKEYGVDFVTDVFENLSEKEVKDYEKNKDAFIIKLLETLETIAKTNNIQNIVIGGVGFLTDNIKLVISKFPTLKKNASLVKIYHSDKPGINELIKMGAVEKVSQKNRVSEETKFIEEVFKRIAKEEFVSYGTAEVKKAVEYGAVETMLVSEDLIDECRANNIFDDLDNLISSGEKAGAVIKIISSNHDAGERFSKIGIAALLRFKI